MDFSSELSERGVTERRFDLQVGNERVPGLVWTPQGALGPRPLVLIGHGGTQHKRIDNVLALARRLVRHHGYAAVAIDAPEHGDRVSPERAARAIRVLRPDPNGPLRVPPDGATVRELLGRLPERADDLIRTLGR